MIYQIKIKGELDRSWSDWLGNVEIVSEPQGDGSAITRLTVDAPDQSTLFGILDHIRDLNITLIMVTSEGFLKMGSTRLPSLMVCGRNLAGGGRTA